MERQVLVRGDSFKITLNKIALFSNSSFLLRIILALKKVILLVAE